jgi:guanylate kinase
MSAPDEKAREEQQPAGGCLFIVSAPSGAGKSTLCRAVRARFPELTYSISYTTRQPRPGEENGVDYHFISCREFKKKIEQGEWAEWARVHGHYYGTCAEKLRRRLAEGRPVLLDIDVAGARQILEKFPESITIFIMPPSLAELYSRLEKRGADDAASIQQRVRTAEKEIARKDFYHYIIVNDRLDQAIEEFCGILVKHAPKLEESARPPGQEGGGSGKGS